MREGADYDALKDDDVCHIPAATMAFDVEDDEYPKAWQYGIDGQPCCTAFVPEGSPVPPPRCDSTADMFMGALDGFPSPRFFPAPLRDGAFFRRRGDLPDLIAARCGAVLLVPIHVVLGRLTGVVDGCPVPWEEVCAVPDDDLSDAPAGFVPFCFDEAAGYGAAVLGLARIAAEGWVWGGLDGFQVFRHESGVRFAVTRDLVFEEKGRDK